MSEAFPSRLATYEPTHPPCICVHCRFTLPHLVVHHDTASAYNGARSTRHGGPRTFHLPRYRHYGMLSGPIFRYRNQMRDSAQGHVLQLVEAFLSRLATYKPTHPPRSTLRCHGTVNIEFWMRNICGGSSGGTSKTKADDSSVVRRNPWPGKRIGDLTTQDGVTTSVVGLGRLDAKPHLGHQYVEIVAIRQPLRLYQA